MPREFFYIQVVVIGWGGMSEGQTSRGNVRIQILLKKHFYKTLLSIIHI